MVGEGGELAHPHLVKFSFSEVHQLPGALVLSGVSVMAVIILQPMGRKIFRRS